MKPGPETGTPENQTRSRPEPVRSPQGHTFGGGTPVHTSRYRGCDLSLSSHSPIANKECHHCGHPAAKPLPYARGECTSSPQPRKGTRFRRDISSQGPGHTGRQAPTPCSMQMPHGTPANAHLKGYIQEPRLPTGPHPDTLTHILDKPRYWN